MPNHFLKEEEGWRGGGGGGAGAAGGDQAPSWSAWRCRHGRRQPVYDSSGEEEEEPQKTRPTRLKLEGFRPPLLTSSTPLSNSAPALGSCSSSAPNHRRAQASGVSRTKGESEAILPSVVFRFAYDATRDGTAPSSSASKRPTLPLIQALGFSFAFSNPFAASLPLVSIPHVLPTLARHKRLQVPINKCDPHSE